MLQTTDGLVQQIYTNRNVNSPPFCARNQLHHVLQFEVNKVRESRHFFDIIINIWSIHVKKLDKTTSSFGVLDLNQN